MSKKLPEGQVSGISAMLGHRTTSGTKLTPTPPSPHAQSNDTGGYRRVNRVVLPGGAVYFAPSIKAKGASLGEGLHFDTAEGAAIAYDLIKVKLAEDNGISASSLHLNVSCVIQPNCICLGLHPRPTNSACSCPGPRLPLFLRDSGVHQGLPHIQRRSALPLSPDLCICVLALFLPAEHSSLLHPLGSRFRCPPLPRHCSTRWSGCRRRRCSTCCRKGHWTLCWTPCAPLPTCCRPSLAR